MDVARLTTRADRADSDRLHLDAEFENVQRDWNVSHEKTNGRIHKLELWKNFILGGASLLAFIVGSLTNQIKTFVFGH